MSYSSSTSDSGLFLDYCYFSGDTIIFVFLIAGVCVGLPALVWALYVLYKCCKNGERISAFIILLLLNDLLDLLLSVFIVSYLFFDDSETFSLQVPTPKYRPGYYYYEYVTQIPCRERTLLEYEYVYTVVNRIWVTFRIDGLYLHQLVALQSILSSKKQTCLAQVFSPLSSIILCIILSLVVFGSQLVYFRHILNVALCLIPFCILGFTCLFAYKVPDNVPHTGRKTRSAVLIVSTFTLFTFCATFVIVLIITYQVRPLMTIYDNMFAFLVTVRVFSDPLLCVLVCKKKLEDQKQQTDVELNTDLQSV